MTEATRATVAKSIIIFLRRVKKPLREVTKRHVEHFLAQRARQPVSSATLRADLVRLRILIRALIAANLLDRDPTEGIEPARARRGAVLVMSERDVARFMAAASHRADQPGRSPRIRAYALRDRACLELLYLGMRQSEVAAARITDIDLQHGQILLRAAKRGPTRALPIPPRAKAWIERWLAEGRPAIVGKPDTGHVLVGQYGSALPPLCGVQEIIRRLCRRTGRSTHPHAFRRAIAGHLIRAGANVAAVQALLGHRRLETTALYLEVDRSELRRAVETLEDLRRNSGGR